MSDNDSHELKTNEHLSIDIRVHDLERDHQQMQKDLDSLAQKQRVNERSDQAIKETIKSAQDQLKGAAGAWKIITIALGAALGGLKLCQVLMNYMN